MQTLTVDLGARSYPIHIGSGLLQRADLLVSHLPYKRAALISNETVSTPLLVRFFSRQVPNSGNTVSLLIRAARL